MDARDPIWWKAGTGEGLVNVSQARHSRRQGAGGGGRREGGGERCKLTTCDIMLRIWPSKVLGRRPRRWMDVPGKFYLAISGSCRRMMPSSD
jgi:hypothetical protein